MLVKIVIFLGGLLAIQRDSLVATKIKVKNDTIDVGTIELRQINPEALENCKASMYVKHPIEHEEEITISVNPDLHAYIFLYRGNPSRNISLKIIHDLKMISSILVRGEKGRYQLTEVLAEDVAFEECLAFFAALAVDG